jgi:hypothetical protein
VTQTWEEPTLAEEVASTHSRPQPENLDDETHARI